MLKGTYDGCVDTLYEQYPTEFELEDAIHLLTSKGEEENDVRFLLASLIRNGYVDYIGSTGYRWWKDE